MAAVDPLADPLRGLLDASRLEALRGCQLMDTAAEARFDRLTELTARLMRVPIAIFGPIDAERQFRKSAVGLAFDPAALAKRGVPVRESVCQYVVGSGAPLAVPDLREHPQLRDLRWIREAGLVAYAGAPVRAPSAMAGELGPVIGSLCVLDVVRRDWTPDELALLEEMAGCFATEVALRSAVTDRARVERELEQTRSRVEELFDSTPVLIQIATVDGRLTIVNRTWRETLGYQESEIAHMRATDIVADEFRADYLARLDTVLDGGQVAPFDTVFVSSDGRRLVIRAQLAARVEDGRVVAIRSTFEDVTAARRAEETQARLVATLEATTDFVAIGNTRGRAVYVNRAGRRLVGIGPAADISGLGMSAVYPPAAREMLITTAIPAAIRNNVWEGETQVVGGDGRQIPVSLVIVAHHSARGGVSYVSMIMRDISEQKRKERELELLQWMTEAVADADDLRTAFQIALDQLCRATGWPFGEVWIPSLDGTVLERAHVWHDDGPGLRELARFSGTCRFRLQEGLPGRAWATRRPTWLRDFATDPTMARAPAASAAGLKAAVAVPVFSNDELVAVVDFHMRELPDEEKYQIQFVSLVASQLGGVMRRKRAEEEMRESEERFRRLADASQEGIIISRHGYLLEANAAWARMFGYELSDAPGMEAAMLVPPEHREALAARLVRNGEDAYITRCVRKDGTTFESAITAKIVLWQGLPARVTVVRDVTEWQRVNRMKSEFVSTVSHELRTPLTSVRGALGLLEGGVVGAINPKALDLIRMARENTDRLIRLINDMLDLDKIEAGRLDLRWATLMPADIVRATLDGISGMADQFGMRIVERVVAHRTFAGDRDRMVQVLTNLVSNAIKFAPTGSAIEVSVDEIRDHSVPFVRFSVHNEGPGISAADRQRLFQKFQQLDGSDTRRRGGTGLGLAISRAIIEEHGGRIGAESEPNVRTTFWFELPVTRATSRAPRQSGTFPAVNSPA
jgi:PAS domain S-box-containing protein